MKALRYAAACVGVVLFWLVAVVPLALAQGSIIERAGAALQADPVYVDPEAESILSAGAAGRLRDRIEAAGAGPVYIAVLPDAAREEAGGSAAEVLDMVGSSVGRGGTYAVVVGEELQAGSTEGTPFAPGVVPSLADEAIAAQGDEEASAVLFAFVGSLEDAIADGSADGSGGFPVGFWPLLLAGGGLAFIISRRRRAQRERRELEEVRAVGMEDLVALGDELRALDLDVEMPGADPKAKEDYVKALGCYERATSTLDRAARPKDLEPVTSALEEGRYALVSTRARLEGRSPPERRTPCFFDPRHGPSVRDVEWAPPGGAARRVPACDPDADEVERGGDPVGREITVGGQRLPYWNAPGYYGPWAGGYYGGFGGFGLFEGMLLGSWLGGGFGDEGGSDGGDAGGGDGGDFGGGDFGGGDFGGGDFGGGDFGGGDFGGGDFGGGDFGG